MKSQPLKPLIVVLGPTGSGKSPMAEQLAEEFNGELISADSRQIYKGMDIGTNKSEAYLTDLINPGEDFSVAQYKELALKTIKEIHNRNNLPILIGGTGLYIQAVVDNLFIPKVKAHPALRAKLTKSTPEELFQKLKVLDPEEARTIQKDNKRRLIRAIEVCLAGHKFSNRNKGKPLFEILQIGIEMNRGQLYQRIDKRVEAMFQDGLEEEVASLSDNLPDTIGYEEFKLKLGTRKTISLIQKHTRRYARRQIGWFKRDERIEWVKDYKQARKLTKDFLSKYVPQPLD
jgi:tRNA dimethylallyltransferase